MMNKSDIELCRAAGFEVLIVGRTRDDLGVGFVAFPEPHGIKAYNYTKQFKKLIALVRKEQKSRQKVTMCNWLLDGLQAKTTCGQSISFFRFDKETGNVKHCFNCGGKVKFMESDDD
jgi:hypothetical protein